FGAAVMLLYGLALASSPFPERRLQAPEAPVAAVWSVLRDPRVLVLAAIDGLHGLLDEPFLGYLNALLERVRGWPPALATAAIGLILLSGIAGYLSVDRIRRRLTGRAPLPLFAGLVALSVGVAAFAPVPWLVVPAAALFGYAGAVFYAQLEATYLSLRPGQAGTTGAVVSAIGLAGIGFPALVGAIADAHGLAMAIALYAALPGLIVPLTMADAWLRKRKTAGGSGEV
ncbi:MAG: MFS transporter, partial [Chloroflexi bacterium]|nr:MFS transporter [Chloroflexota bacterium]